MTMRAIRVIQRAGIIDCMEGRTFGRPINRSVGGVGGGYLSDTGLTGVFFATARILSTSYSVLLLLVYYL
jgi:hypothetical protein